MVRRWRNVNDVDTFTAALVPQVRDFIAEHPVQRDFGKRWERTLPKDAYLCEDPAVGVTAPEECPLRFPIC
jgi:hypothetical protein